MHRTALILLVLCIAVPARAEDDCATLAAKHDAADSSVCVDFNYDTDTCITEQDRLRQRLSQQCRDSRPRARGQRFDLTIVVPTTNRNATYLRDTLQSLWADLGPCGSGSRVHVAVYNTGDHRNRPFFDMERAAGDRIACTSFVRWFHQYKQPFPEVPYIAEGGPLWNRRRDIPDSEQVEQTFDYISMLRDAAWYFPSRAFLLVEDDFRTCAGAMNETARLLRLLSASEPTWGGAQLSYGGAGWLLHAGYLRQLAHYMEGSAYSKPVDLLFHEYFARMQRPMFAATYVLFEHTGDVSSFPSRQHNTFPRCYERNTAMHFLSHFEACPYQGMSGFLCDLPHSSILTGTASAEHGAAYAGVGADGAAFAMPQQVPPAAAQWAASGHDPAWAGFMSGGAFAPHHAAAAAYGMAGAQYPWMPGQQQQQQPWAGAFAHPGAYGAPQYAAQYAQHMHAQQLHAQAQAQAQHAQAQAQHQFGMPHAAHGGMPPPHPAHAQAQQQQQQQHPQQPGAGPEPSLAAMHEQLLAQARAQQQHQQQQQQQHQQAAPQQGPPSAYRPKPMQPAGQART